MMRWTRLSLFYLIGYLSAGGIVSLADPVLALNLLASDKTYPPEMVRMLGAMMAALAILVAQIVRHRAQMLYPATLVARVVLLATIIWLLIATGNPLFLTIGGVVAVGMTLTSLGWLADRVLHHASEAP